MKHTSENVLLVNDVEHHSFLHPASKRSCGPSPMWSILNSSPHDVVSGLVATWADNKQALKNLGLPQSSGARLRRASIHGYE